MSLNVTLQYGSDPPSSINTSMTANTKGNYKHAQVQVKIMSSGKKKENDSRHSSILKALENSSQEKG